MAAYSNSSTLENSQVDRRSTLLGDACQPRGRPPAQGLVFPPASCLQRAPTMHGFQLTTLLRANALLREGQQTAIAVWPSRHRFCGALFRSLPKSLSTASCETARVCSQCLGRQRATRRQVPCHELQHGTTHAVHVFHEVWRIVEPVTRLRRPVPESKRCHQRPELMSHREPLQAVKKHRDLELYAHMRLRFVETYAALLVTSTSCFRQKASPTASRRVGCARGPSAASVRSGCRT